jgi:hypothetical protein
MSDPSIVMDVVWMVCTAVDQAQIILERRRDAP